MTIDQATLKKALSDKRYWTDEQWLAHYKRRVNHPSNRKHLPSAQPFDDALRPAHKQRSA